MSALPTPPLVTNRRVPPTALAHPARLGAAGRDVDVLGRQLVPVDANVSRSARPSSTTLGRHVGHVLAVRTEEQVLDLVARPVVAVVADEQSTRDGAMGLLPGIAVSGHASSPLVVGAPSPPSRPAHRNVDVAVGVGRVAGRRVARLGELHANQCIAVQGGEW